MSNATIPSIDAVTEGKERRALKAKRILNRNNAQEILKALKDLEERRPEFSTRWLWELMQNARDFPEPSRPMIIRVTVSPAHIRFAHNGRAFKEDELLSLIYHGSTKQDEPALLGKFGTGFLSTHLLSRKVTVRSTLVEETGEQVGFEFDLDRTGADAVAVGDAMERSVLAFERSLSARAIDRSEWTEYVYDIADGNTTDDAQNATRFQLDAIPYVLAFDENISTIDIDVPQLHCVFKREPGEQLSDGTPITVVSNGADVIRLAMIREQDVSVAVPIKLGANSKPELVEIGAVPKLFIFLPLVGSSDIGIPAAFNSRSFEPVEGRDGLHLEPGAGTKSETNRRTLSSAGDLLVKLAQRCSSSECDGLHRLLGVHSPYDSPAWLKDKTWYRTFQQDVTRKLANLPLVRTKATVSIPAIQGLFPVGDARLSWQKTFEFSSRLFVERLPDITIAEDCSRVANDWMSLFEIDEPIRRDNILSSERLFSTIRNAGSLSKCSSLLAFEIEGTLAWLNQLILSVPEDQRRMSLDGLLPDQTDAGAFRTFDKLARDNGIDDHLKGILERLGDPIRERLLHRGALGADKLITRVEREENVVTATKDLLKKRLNEVSGISASGTRTACLSLFAWFAERGRWNDLKDSMPVITLDRDTNEMLAKTSDRTPELLIPRAFWPEEAKQFWNAFPPGSVLVDDYSPLLDQPQWQATTREGIVLGDLIWSEKDELNDPEELGLQLELEGEGHACKFEVQVTKMAFVGSDFFYESVRKNRERAARFLLFLLEYAALADNSWQRREEISCECGKTHVIVPCDWLAWVRRKQWIPRRNGSDHLTTESLARLAQDNRELAEALTRKELEQFLEILGINVLEQALLATDQAHRSELRRKLAQLAKLASQNPGEVEQLIQDIESRRKAAERWKNNRSLGSAVEQLVGAMLRAILKDRGIRVETNFVGYDLAAYYEGHDTTEEEVGCIQVSAGALLAKIEIKATRGNGVSMSYAQGQAATNDRDNYWLCVVSLAADEPISALDPSRIEKAAHFVPNVGDTLATSNASIDSALQGAVAGGFELQHVEEIRYGISHTMWENSGILLKDFVETLARRVTA